MAPRIRNFEPHAEKHQYKGKIYTIPGLRLNENTKNPNINCLNLAVWRFKKR